MSFLSDKKRSNLAFSVKRKELYDYHSAIHSNHWLANTVSYAKEHTGFMKLPTKVRNMILRILAFFSSSDGIVIANLADRFIKEIDELGLTEASNFYILQDAQEVIHNETYFLLISSIVKDEALKEELLNSSIKDPFIKKIHDWAISYMDPSIPLIERIVAFAGFEGILFASAFACVRWIKSICKGDDMSALTTTNEYIARDECLHADFAITLYKVLTDEKSPDKHFEPLSEQRLKEIIGGCVDVGLEFTRYCMDSDFHGMTIEDMQNYVRSVADVMCSVKEGFGCGSIYGVENPFPWMTIMSLRNKTNFFEYHATDYSKQRKAIEDWGVSVF